MKDSPSLTVPLSTIDLVCLLMDSETWPLDFTLILHFRRSLEYENLVLGADSARKAFPVSASVVDGKSRHFDEDLTDDFPETRSSARGYDAETHIGVLVDRSIELVDETPLQQLLVRDAVAGGFHLATKVHHCAADLLSCLEWVSHQLSVASGLRLPSKEIAPLRQIALADAPRGARRNPDRGTSERLWTRAEVPFEERHWSSFSIPVGGLEDLSRDRNGFTYNDILAAAALETAHWWNTRMRGHADRVGLWLPINIRREPFVGFGNGSSRIRIRHQFEPSATIREKCLGVRSQVDRARRNGEWVVPQKPLALRWPMGLAAPALRAYLRRPWADMGTLSFTHVQRWPGRDDECFRGLVDIQVVGALHPQHPLMLAAVTCHDRTWLTATYDPCLLWEEDIDAISQHFREVVFAASKAV